MKSFISYNTKKTLQKSVFLVLDFILITFIVVTTIFFIMNLIPGRLADIESSFAHEKEFATALIKKLGLDQNIFIRYGIYLKNLFTFNLGTSTSVRPLQEVNVFLFEKSWISFKVGSMSVILSLLAGVPLGFFFGKKLTGARNNFSIIIVAIGISIPSFAFGLFFIIILYKLNLPCLYDVNKSLSLLPAAISSAIPGVAVYIRYLKTSIAQEKNEQYTKFAKAKGCSESRILWRHNFKLALYPIATYLPITFLSAFGGSVIIESVFSIPGIGHFLVEAIQMRDIDVVQAIMFIITITTILGFFLRDILYTILDPRARV